LPFNFDLPDDFFQDLDIRVNRSFSECYKSDFEKEIRCVRATERDKDTILNLAPDQFRRDDRNCLIVPNDLNNPAQCAYCDGSDKITRFELEKTHLSGVISERLHVALDTLSPNEGKTPQFVDGRVASRIKGMTFAADKMTLQTPDQIGVNQRIGSHIAYLCQTDIGTPVQDR
jgi:hypothetical protein